MAVAVAVALAVAAAVGLALFSQAKPSLSSRHHRAEYGGMQGVRNAGRQKCK